MQRKMFLLPLLVAMVAVGTPMAFGQDADPDTGLIEELLNLGVGDVGIGAVAGFGMSLVAVFGKRIKTIQDKAGNIEPIKLNLLLITIAIGGAVAWLAPHAGIMNEVSVPAVIGLTYVVNQTLRPILAKWETRGK